MRHRSHALRTLLLGAPQPSHVEVFLDEGEGLVEAEEDIVRYNNLRIPGRELKGKRTLYKT